MHIKTQPQLFPAWSWFMWRLAILIASCFIWQPLHLSAILFFLLTIRLSVPTCSHSSFSLCCLLLLFLHYSEVIYNACGVMVPCNAPHWSSNKPPAVASDCYLCRLPIILLVPSTKQRGRDIVFIERERESNQKEQEERVIRSIERRFFSPVAQRRFHWKAVAVYRSALRDRYCEAKDGGRGGGRDSCYERNTKAEQHSVVWEENLTEKKNKGGRPKVVFFCGTEVFLSWSTISVAMSCL